MGPSAAELCEMERLAALAFEGQEDDETEDEPEDAAAES